MSFVPAHSVLQGEAGGGRTVFLLHGILGSGRNWRSFARRVVLEVPSARVVLVDLRNHGESDGASGPHTLAAAADDLASLSQQIGRPQVVVGHSFGGKVAAAYSERHPQGLERAWILDSRLDAVAPEGDNEVAQVIRSLREVPQPLDSREHLVELLQGRGFSPALARWMTTNLRRDHDGLRWAFHLPGVEQMIEDYWRTDLEDLLDSGPVPLSLVLAGRSDRWPEEIVERYRRRATQAVGFHVLPQAGHWLHVDDPDGLLRVLVSSIGAERQA